MLIFDELRKNDPQLRLLAMALAAGLFVLLAGVWWVQVVSSREYQGALETQAYRTVRVPAIRGKILDRDGRVLAENRAKYNLSLYLDDLRKRFVDAYQPLLKQALTVQKQTIAAQEKRLGRSLTKAERKQFALNPDQLEGLRGQACYSVANSVVSQVGQKLGQSLALDPKKFLRAYRGSPYVPYPILQNLDPTQVARFEESFTAGLGVGLDLRPTRYYPFGVLASHLIGHVQNDDSSVVGEEAFFDYRLPDYRGLVGIEGGFDGQLHGHAGAESVLVNNLGYRQPEGNVWEQPEPGHNIVTTIDLDIQRAAEESLVSHQGLNARAAIVVMDVRSGDILTMVSSPAIDPNYYTGSVPPDQFQKEGAKLSDPKLTPEINRATQGSYIPGSIFKPIVALAALENGLNPNEIYQVQPNPRTGAKDPSAIRVGTRIIGDTVLPGPYDLKLAIKRSSNSYFIHYGLQTGIDKIVDLGEKLHLGQRMDLKLRQEDDGNFPTRERIHKPDWRDGDSANIFFGQGEVSVTPMQVAVAYSAIANGGKVLWPRLIQRIEPQDPLTSGEQPTLFPAGLLRDDIGVSQHSLKILYNAMMSETEDPDGTGYPAFHQKDEKLNLKVCGKTGTAQVEDQHGAIVLHNYWFASFAPYENPKWAVVVMVSSEAGGSGGIVCAPIAHDVYAAILKKQSAGQANQKTLAAN
jgi:penicillin-binding protein 2